MSEPIPLRDEHSPLALQEPDKEREREGEKDWKPVRSGEKKKKERKEKKVTTTLDAWLGPGLVPSTPPSGGGGSLAITRTLFSNTICCHCSTQSRATLVCSSLVGWFLLVFALLQPLPPPPPPNAFIPSFAEQRYTLSLPFPPSLFDRCRALSIGAAR